MKKWTYTVTIEVADNWIADGFDGKDCLQDIEEYLSSSLLPYADDHERIVKCKLKSAPAPEIIEAIQNGD